MILHWLAIVRCTAIAAAVAGLAMGGGMAAVLIAEAGEAWTSALTAGIFGALFGGVFFIVVIATSDTVSVARTACSYGISLDDTASEIPCVRRIEAPVTRGRTEFQLADGILYEIKKSSVPRVDGVVELGHGKISLRCVTPSGARVKVRIRISVSRSATVAVLECRPEATWKRLDGGASWGVAVSLEPRVRAGLTLPDG